MKKFTFLAFTAFFLFSFNSSFAQQRPAPINPNGNRLHCATMEGLELWFQQNPAARTLAEQNQNRFAPEPTNNRTNRTNVVINIPIVFHIVGNATRLAQVTDADVLWQLNKLNEDFRGANADSVNAPLFQSIRAYKDYAQIQFCLAQRDPNNNPLTTPGITRTLSSLTGTAICNNTNIIKHTASGGIDAWDPTRFFNVWVGEAGLCLLGIAQFPGTGNANEFGVLLAFDGFSNNPAYVDPSFNLGRTLPHEIGHCFGLFHIWGDESACSQAASGFSGDDFRQLNGTFLMPASLVTPNGDTPNQGGATSGCPSGLLTDGCSGASPGINYQNYMDYTNDACYSMFTLKQVDRMQYTLDNHLASLKTSNGCVPPVLSPNNASISAINTPPTSFITCDPTIPLTVTLRNAGSNALTSAIINVTRNGSPIQTFNWSGNLASLATVPVPLNPVPLVLGANTIQICVTQPNGAADSDPGNDCMTVSGTRGAGGALPLVEGFESATFPPTGWIRNNPDGGITWQRTTLGVAHSGTGKAFVDHFNYVAAGNTDDLRTPPYAIGQADSLWVSFWGAYRGFPGFPFDFFQVMVSADCGQTFQTVYNARNDTAFVAPEGASPTFGTGGYYPSALDQWKRKSIDLSSFIPGGNLQVQFRAINQFGNNMHLDDINIDKKIFPNNDAGVIAVNKPQSRVCVNSLAPEVTIKNYGKVALTSVRINYQIDGTGPVTTFNWTGNLARNQTATVTLATANLGAVGNHTINVYTSLPNNVADEDPSNDGLVKAYNVSQVFALPGSVTEEFTSATFPPPNWIINNPNADITWTRNSTIGNKNPGSAYFNDFVNTTVDRIDDLSMPNYSYSGVDSVFLSFNLAHITKTLPGTTGARLDTLTILLSKDCGNTFTTIYKKYGEELQTVNDPNFQISMNNFTPLPSQWRRDSLNLGKWLGATEPLFQITYRFSGNMENNFYLDDVNIRTQVLPARLKNDGYLILPNPFRNTFSVWHYQVPTTLRYVNVYNSVGQLVYSKQFPSGGNKLFQIDLSGRAAGMYTVNIGYEDSNRNVNVQIVKF